MSLTLTITGNSTEETYFSEDSWETKTLKKEVRQKVSSSDTESVITVYAKVERNGASDVHEVVKWSHSDLYAYSTPPQVDFANFFGALLDYSDALTDAEPLEFEVQTVAFWNEARKSNQFLGMSDTYDELVATFQILSVGYNGILDDPKIAALRVVLRQLREIINLTDEILDALLDVLAEAGFDLQAPMGFAEAVAAKQVVEAV